MKMRRNVVFSLLLLLAMDVAGQNQKPQPPPPQNAKQKPSPGFMDRVLSFLGISDSPGTLKGPGDEVVNGSLVVVDLGSRSSVPLAGGDGFRSPVFLPGSNDVLALKGTDVVRFATHPGEPKTLFTVPGILKLVGAGKNDPNSVLILQSNESGAHPHVALLSVSTGKIAPLTYDSASDADLQAVEDLQGWTRTYGDKQLEVRSQKKQALSGVVEWSDVFLKVDGQQSVNVSRCNGTNCGQPSLSGDGKLVVFVKGTAQ